MSSVGRIGAVLACGVLLFAGCKDGGDFDKAPVSGRVVADGQPVKGGSITFRPVSSQSGDATMSGRPSSAEVKDDGTFVLADGAVIGKHQVIYTPFAKGAETYEDEPEPSPYAGMTPKESEVEVKAGENTIEVELVKKN